MGINFVHFYRCIVPVWLDNKQVALEAQRKDPDTQDNRIWQVFAIRAFTNIALAPNPMYVLLLMRRRCKVLQNE
jgi:hypothetical protein